MLRVPLAGLLIICYNCLVFLYKGNNLEKRVIIGSDHGGFILKSEIVRHLQELGYEPVDMGCFSRESCDYPVVAKMVVKEVLNTSSRGILVCGTGIGMSIAANRFDGIRASLCSDTYSARMTRTHNDSNVLCLGERVLGIGLAIDIVDAWLNTEFEGGRHKKRIDMI